MSKEICISTTPHETRLAILENDELTEIYYERENEYTLAGSIYKGRVTRVLPGMQSAFVDIGLERDAFLYVTDFLEEQEDSADFERTNLSGGQPRRDNGRARQPQSEPNAAQESAASPARVDAPVEDDSPSGTRRWRGRRGRGRGVRQRGRDNNERESSPRDEQVQNSPVEAGSEEIRYDAPVIDKRIDETEATFARRSPASAPSAGNGRTLLPGESLSKYGAAPAAEPSKPQTKSTPAFKTNYTSPKPSTLIETTLTWDGSSLLPGESRAPRTKTPPEFGSESRPEPDFAESQITEPQASEPVYEIQPEGNRASQRQHRQEEPQTVAAPATFEDTQPPRRKRFARKPPHSRRHSSKLRRIRKSRRVAKPNRTTSWKCTRRFTSLSPRAHQRRIASIPPRPPSSASAASQK